MHWSYRERERGRETTKDTYRSQMPFVELKTTILCVRVYEGEECREVGSSIFLMDEK